MTELSGRSPQRVLMLAPRYDYGDPARGNSFEYDYFFPALQKLCERVDFVDSLSLRGLDPEKQYQQLSSSAGAMDATLLFCVLFRDEPDPRVLSDIRDKVQVPVVNWFCDDHWRYSEFSRVLAPHLSLSVTTDAVALERYRSDGFPVFKSQWGAPLHSTEGMRVHSSPTPSLVFVGQTYGRRRAMLQRISRRLGHEALHVYGYGTERGRLSTMDMYRAFNENVASLNFSDSWNGRVRESLGYLVPSVRRPRQIKARVFEVTAAGGVLVTQNAPGLADYFAIGTEIHVAEDADTVVAIVRQLVQDPDSRTRMAEAGQRRAVREHSVVQRLAGVLGAACG